MVSLGHSPLEPANLPESLAGLPLVVGDLGENKDSFLIVLSLSDRFRSGSNHQVRVTSFLVVHAVVCAGRNVVHMLPERGDPVFLHSRFERSRDGRPEARVRIVRKSRMFCDIKQNWRRRRFVVNIVAYRRQRSQHDCVVSSLPVIGRVVVDRFKGGLIR